MYAAGFFAMLLGNILFLTGVWHYSIMRAGLAVTPGPLVVAMIAGPAGKLAGRIGFRPVLLARRGVLRHRPGCYVVLVDATPDYLAHWLPGTLIVGLGVGLHVPGAERRPPSARCRPHRFAVGSAVNQTARQIGGALGIAVLVMLIGIPRGPPRRSTASTSSGSSPPSPHWHLGRDRLDDPEPAHHRSKVEAEAEAEVEERPPSLTAVGADLPLATDVD